MACTDVQTIQAGNGTKTQFSFDFPYIFKSEIHVYFWNAVTKEYDEKLTTDATYPWQITDANPTIVEFTGTAPPSPATPVDPNEPTVDNVKIRRITKVDDIRALFNPGSAIRSDDLNKNFEQLRYAIQESNCAGIPDDVDDYLKTYYWNNFDSTVYSTETWDSDDDQVATTAAIDARIDSKVDDALTLDIIGTDGVSVTDDTPGSGQITIGLSDDSVDFDKIKDADQIKLADQTADYDNAGSDDKVFTSLAAIRRFENYVQTSTPTPTAGIGKGAVWLDNDQDLTLSVWNGSAWIGVASGGTFTNQPKVVYVDASSGDDNNDGHRISRPKASIKAAVNQINADSTYGDGSVVIVAAGVYQEAAPIQIQKKNVSIIGQALRSCIVHPTVATQGDQSTGNHALFELNSGSFIQNLTLTGMKAGTSGTNTVDSVLPAAQGWNFAFYSGATITKSPYIQNCTNFSDSEIDNSNLNANTPAGGLAGDTDSAPTGGGMLVDGSVVATTSPLRSMVADSYTHVGLNGPGILVTNNGYCQATSSYAFFNKYHIKTLNGGQANLAASTTDFGEKALVADGKSTTAIFTASTTAAAADGATSFTIDAPVADSSWFGSANRPASNMLVTLNSVTYPVLSAAANGTGWDVTISRPNPSRKSENLGLNGAVASGSSATFFLRSMIASSGHTMEYVGSGTDYSALPENGGVPNDTDQITELNDGKIWTATTDHNGKFTVGPLEVDQRSGAITIESGSQVTSVVDDPSPQLGGNLDVNGNQIVSTSNGDITINPNGTGDVVLDANVGIGTSSPAGNLHVAAGTTARFFIEGSNGRSEIRGNNGNLSFFTNEDQNASGGSKTIFYNGANESMRINNNGLVGIGTSSPDYNLTVGAGSTASLNVKTTGNDTAARVARMIWSFNDGDGASINAHRGTSETAADVQLSFRTGGITNSVERMRIDASGKVGIGTTAPAQKLVIQSNNIISTATSGIDRGTIHLQNVDGTAAQNAIGNAISFSRIGSGRRKAMIGSVQTGTDVNQTGFAFYTYNGTTASTDAVTERVRIESSGNVGIGTTSPAEKLDVSGNVVVRGTQPEIALDETDTDTTARLTVAAGDLYIQAGAAGSGPASSSGDIRFTGYNAQDVTEFQVKSGGSYRNIWHSGNDGTGSGLDADTVDGIEASSFLRSDTSDSATGPITFNGDVLIRTALDFADGDVLRMGSSDDWTVTYNSNGWNYINQKQNGIIFQDNGTQVARLEDNAIFRPENNYGGQIGTSSQRWNYGYFRYVRGQSSGSPGLNNTTVGFAMDNGGAGYFSRSSNLALSVNRNSNGTVINLARSGSQKGNIQVTTSGATFNSASDYRLKENVVALSNGITRLKQLSPSRFNFIEEPNITVDGFIAHEAQAVVPEAVTGTQDEVEAIGTLTEYDGTVLETNTPQPDSLTWEETLADEDGNETTHVRTRTWVKTGDQPVYQGIDQSKLVPLLTAALQEAIAKIETLETQNSDLLARVTALENA